MYLEYVAITLRSLVCPLVRDLQLSKLSIRLRHCHQVFSNILDISKVGLITRLGVLTVMFQLEKLRLDIIHFIIPSDILRGLALDFFEQFRETEAFFFSFHLLKYLFSFVEIALD